MSNKSNDITIKGIAFILFCLSLLTVPVNIALFNIIRLSDIFLLTSFIIFSTVNPSVKTIYLTIFSTFFGILLLSSLISILHNSSIKLSGLAFYYKYFLIFLIPWIVTGLVNNRNRLIKTVSILYWIFILLTTWVFLYYFLRTNDFIIGSQRVSYPFSNLSIPDAHLYSSYLSFTFVAYLEYIRKVLRHGRIHSYLICFFATIALFLTGSKTGILIISIYFMILVLHFFINSRKTTLILVALAVCTMTLMFISITKIDIKYKEDIIQLSNRAITYDISNASIKRRYLYLLDAIEEIQHNYFLIGNGPTGSSRKWYDGGFSIIMAHSGALGFFVLLIYIYKILTYLKKIALRSNSDSLLNVFTLLLLTYLLLIFITEHFLITRNVLPIVTLLSLVYANIKINYIDYIVSKQQIYSMS